MEDALEVLARKKREERLANAMDQLARALGGLADGSKKLQVNKEYRHDIDARVIAEFTNYRITDHR